MPMKMNGEGPRAALYEAPRQDLLCLEGKRARPGFVCLRRCVFGVGWVGVGRACAGCGEGWIALHIERVEGEDSQWIFACSQGSLGCVVQVVESESLTTK